MNIINPGNVLPVYANIASQLSNRAGCEFTDWAIPVAEGDSLRVQVPVAVGVNTWTFIIYNSDNTVYSSLILNYSYFATADNENAWISYNGGNSTLNGLPCGVYYIKMTASDRSASYVTEKFRVMSIANKKRAYRLDFYHSGDMDGIVYQFGFEQRMWILDGVFDTPEIVEPVSNITDGNAVEQPVFQSVQRREVLRFPYFPDFWQGSLHMLRMYDNVVLTKIETGETWQLAGQGLQLTTDPQDEIFSRGVLSWRSSTQVTAGCGTNYVFSV